MIYKTFFITCACFLLFAQCNDNLFDAKAPGFKERIVVFAVLDPSTNQQMVRLAKSYDSKTTNPKDAIGSKIVDSAIVIIRGKYNSVLLRDTTLIDSTGSKTKVWIGNGLPMYDGDEFSLDVEVSGYDPLSSHVTIPSKPFIYARSTDYGSGAKVIEIGTTSNSTFAPAKGYLFQLWLQGIVTVNGQDVKISRQVPIEISQVNGQEQWIYPSSSRDLSIRIPITNFSRVLERLDLYDKAKNIVALVKGYSLDNNFYSYYYAVRGFGDPLTVRQDMPDVSNITNGFGVFGAMNADSVKYSTTDITM